MGDEFTIDIDKALENAKTDDLAGSFVDKYPNGVESVRKSVENCEQLAGLDRKLMQDIIKGEFTQYETLNSDQIEDIMAGVSPREPDDKDIEKSQNKKDHSVGDAAKQNWITKTN